jgi:hypothetical protein
VLEALDFSVWMKRNVGWALVFLANTSEIAVAKWVKHGS